MSEINLLNKPGIQKETDSIVERRPVKDPEKKIRNKKNNVKKTSSNKFFFIGIGLFVIVLITMLYYRENDDSTVLESNFSVSYLLNMISEDYENIQLNEIKHNNKNIHVVIEVKTEEKLYEQLELFKSFNYDVKGTKVAEKFFLYIKGNWNLIRSNDRSLMQFQKYLREFKGTEYELLNDKIIIVSTIGDLTSIINLCEKNNLMNNYLFDISKIDNNNSNNYYKLIIEDYD